MGKGQGRIDIFLDNSGKYIIIENKIDAGDQFSQIYKYVNCIYEEQNKEVKPNDIMVLYLTKYGNSPSNDSLDNFEITDGYLTERGIQKAAIKCIGYDDILKWVEKNLLDIKNISNLRESIIQYIKAVKVILNKEENIMNLKDYLLMEENRDALIDLFENYDEFIKNIDESCKNLIMKENLGQVIVDIKYTIRMHYAKAIKEYLSKSNYLIYDGHKPFGAFAKMSYLLLTKEDLRFGYILFFENQDIKNLRLGKIYCKDCDSKDLPCIKKKCSKTYCWDVIKDQKCFEEVSIDSFDNLDFYINYFKNDFYIKSVIEKIVNRLF